jgi:hypothetical protein
MAQGLASVVQAISNIGAAFEQSAARAKASGAVIGEVLLDTRRKAAETAAAVRAVYGETGGGAGVGLTGSMGGGSSVPGSISNDPANPFGTPGYQGGPTGNSAAALQAAIDEERRRRGTR